MAALAACSEPLSFTVHALDGAGMPVAGARLEVVGQGLVVSADAAGALTLANVVLDGRFAVKLSASGYETLFRSLVFQPGTVGELIVHMRTAGTPHHVTLPPIGQQLTVAEGIATLAINGGSLAHADGSDVTGDVDVQITPFDPAVDVEPPATMLTIGGAALVSAGMATITITQGAEALQPKAGQPLAWTMEVNPALGLIAGRQSPYHMYYVDESRALWVRDDSATLTWSGTEGVDLRWTAMLPHLTIWNTDGELGNGECVTGQVIDAFGRPTTSASVTAGGDWGTSGSSGIPGGQVSVCAGYRVGFVNEPGAQEYIPECSQYQTVTAGGTSYLFAFPLAEIDQGNQYGGPPQYRVTHYPIPVAMSVTLTVTASVPGQSVRGGASTSVTPGTGPGCATVNFQLCLNDGQTCTGGGACCNGACGANGKCGAPTCSPLGGTCNLTNDCCSGTCSNGHCGTTPSPCTSNGQTCQNGVACCCSSSNGDCSAGSYACNWRGTCGPPSCSSEGGTCRTATDCCSGTCTNGVCVTPSTPPACTANGQACQNNAPCCCSASNGDCSASDYACNWKGTCGPPGCSGTGSVCRSSGDCCGGTCLNNSCVNCADHGAGCSSSGDCCAGNLCVRPAPGQTAAGSDNTCQSCIPNGHGSCSNGSQCCGGLCIGSVCQSCVPQGASASLGSCCPGLSIAANGTCELCSASGATCTGGGECCSGTCSDHFCL